MAKKIDVTKLSWEELNATLLKCEDEQQLNTWLGQIVTTGLLKRSLRVYGRYCTVRRKNELSVLKFRVSEAVNART